jgi:putative addiction module killer protein
LKMMDERHLRNGCQNFAIVTHMPESVQGLYNRVKLGNFGIIKALGDGVIELKIDYGPGYRVYYAMNGKTIVLLLIGGDKATQTKDIKVAKAYWARQQRG